MSQVRANLKIDGILCKIDFPEGDYMRFIDLLIDAGYEIEGLTEEEFQRENERLDRMDAEGVLDNQEQLNLDD